MARVVGWGTAQRKHNRRLAGEDMQHRCPSCQKRHSVFDEGDSRSNFNRERSEEQTQAVIDL
jgi:hypothetical protein